MKQDGAGGGDPRSGGNWWLTARRRCSRIGLALLVMMLIWVGIQMVAGAGLRWYGINVDKLPTWLQLAIGNGPLYVLAMPLAVLVMRAVPALPTRRFPLGAARFVTLLVICVPIMYAGSAIGAMCSAVLSQGAAQNPIAGLSDTGDPLAIGVLMVLIAPVFEEWIFRKQLLDRLRRYGEVPAMLISATAFGLFHLNLFQFFYAFGLGLVFAYVYLRTSRLRYSVAMHMIVNLNGGVIAPRLLSMLDDKTLARFESGTVQEREQLLEQSGSALVAVAVYGTVLFALIIVGIVLLIINRRRIEWYRAPEELPRGTRMRTMVVNPGMMIYMVLCIAITLVALRM